MTDISPAEASKAGGLLSNSIRFLELASGWIPCEAGGVVINITGAGFHPTDASKHLVIVSETGGEGFFFFMESFGEVGITSM